MLRGRRVHPRVSLDVNPTSRDLLETLAREGPLADLIRAGARLHQTGCNGCIGMGQAPATGRPSLRTTPRNFPGRSGTREDSVYLCSPETATASALAGCIADPRELEMRCPRVEEPAAPARNRALLDPPLPGSEARRVELVRGPNITPLPEFEPLPDALETAVLLRCGDDVSTDEILPAGARVLPFRSNIPAISRFAFETLDEGYPERALELREKGGHAIVAGENYGQGSSREHAALAPRFLGLRLVLAASFARIHWQNLVNFGVLPLVFGDPGDRERIEPGTVLQLGDLARSLRAGPSLRVRCHGGADEIAVRHELSPRQVEVLLAGGLIPWMRRRSRQDLERGQSSPPSRAL
jgi:aconitate hydratase